MYRNIITMSITKRRYAANMKELKRYAQMFMLALPK
jgi:hypothetical protein